MNQETESKTEQKTSSPKKLAVIRIRGLVGVNKEIKNTLNLLRLRKKHVCVIINNSSSNTGMIRKIKDYVTYGEIDKETEQELISKRGKKTKDEKLKPFFELAPPKKGFEKNGIKKSFQQGGVLGYRGIQINNLIKRML